MLFLLRLFVFVLLYALLTQELLTAKSLGVRVQAEEYCLVTKRILVLRPWALVDLGICRANNRLDLGAVD